MPPPAAIDTGYPLGVIEHVESLSTELKIEALVQLEVLVHGHVEVPSARIVQQVAPRVALSQPGGFCKCIRD